MYMVTPPALVRLNISDSLLVDQQCRGQRLCPSPRFPPSMFIKMVMVLCASLGIGVWPLNAMHVEATTVNCTLIVPEDPLSANGLVTPYQLMRPCHETNAEQSVFVQGAAFDPATGQIAVYDPLVIDQGTMPARPTVTPKLPKGAIIALWFGFNGAVLTLKRNNGFRQGMCIDGLDNKSPFGQFAYCNAPAFFDAANKAIRKGKLVPPPLGLAKDGLTCPSTRDFSVVDQDQSDNVTTSYLALNNGRTAQNTAANRFTFAQRGQQFTVLVNPSDNKLLVGFIDPALGCDPWMVSNLADPGHLTTALPLNELQASVRQRSPVALVPAGDPMVLVDDHPNLQKLNLFRIGVDQPPVESLDQANTADYCLNLLRVGVPRLFRDAPLTIKAPSPDPAAANNLFTFLAQRFNMTWGAEGLNCMGLLGLPSPIVVTVNDEDVAINATLNINNHLGGK